MDSGQIKKKFLGSLLGAALGDAVGASWEGHWLAEEPEIKLRTSLRGILSYTDDTHMTIGVAESLAECAGFDGAHMAGRFVDNYYREPWRGYGPGPPRVFRLIKGGKPWDKVAGDIYPGGSFGNGAGMRAAPIGLFFWNRPAELREVAYQSSRITHAHILGMEGAALQAMAVSLAVAEDSARPFDPLSFLSRLLDFTTEDTYRDKLGKFSMLLEHPDDRKRVVRELGHGIEAFNSVPTAIFAFLSHPADFTSTVIYAISLGGDTDTIASMAGAIAGAYLGVDCLPTDWLGRLENHDYLFSLAERLWRQAASTKTAGKGIAQGDGGLKSMLP